MYSFKLPNLIKMLYRKYMYVHEVGSMVGIGSFFGASNGRNSAPNKMQLRTIAAMISNATRQPNILIKISVNGANMHVPRPEPHTAMPINIT